RREVAFRLQHLFQQVLELLRTVDLAHQVAQLGARLDESGQGRNLGGHARRFEVLDLVELEIDRHLGAVIGQLVVDLQLEAGVHAGHDVIEVVTVDLGELAVCQRPQRGRRIAGKIAHDADDERQFALDFRALGLDIVGDVHPRLANPLELVVDTGAHWKYLRSGEDTPRGKYRPRVVSRPEWPKWRVFQHRPARSV